MKTGLTTSVVMHAVVLGFGLMSLSAPTAFEVADIESLPVDIIPVESITQVQKGDKKATLSEKPAPVPTKRPDIVPDAQEVGENNVDTDKPPTPEAKPKPVEAAAVPAPSPKPEPKPADEPKPEPVKQPEPKPATVPATEAAPVAEPKQDVKPDPVSEAIAADTPDAAEALKLPDSAPAPQAKPQPPKAQTAKAPDRKDAEKPVKEAAAKPKSDEKEFDADEVAALLNKEKPSGGGAKRSTEQASLGGDKSTGGSKLSQSAARSSAAGTFRQVRRTPVRCACRFSSGSTARARSKAAPRSSPAAAAPASSAPRRKRHAAPSRAALPTIFPPTSMTPGRTSLSISIQARCSERVALIRK